MCSESTPEHPKPKRSLFSRSGRDPGAYERLVDADRLDLLRYARHLTVKAEDGSLNPKNMQKYLPYLRSIPKLRTLTLGTFHLHPHIPVFYEHFGMFTSTLRHLDIRNAECGAPELLYIICQFPLLEDLTIMSPTNGIILPPGHPVPTITQSPPLRGKLVLVQAWSRELSEGLAAFPGGLNFRSLELSWCNNLEVIFAVCHTVTSISYLWRGPGIDGELNPSVQPHIVIRPFGTTVTPLDLKRNVVLERFEFDASLTSLCQIHGWIHRTLQTITSPLFNEFVIWLPDQVIPWHPMRGDGWKVVDGLLNVLAERNPDFRVVFKGCFYSFFQGNLDGVRSFITSYLPLISSNRLVKFEYARVGSRFGRSDGL